jgi:hypothetical protein
MEGMEGSIKFTLEFPGDITKTVPADLPDSVTVDGNVVNIDSDLTETLDIQMFSERGGATGGSGEDGEGLGSGNDDDGGSNVLGIGIVIAVAVAALVGVAYLVVRRRSNDTPTIE